MTSLQEVDEKSDLIGHLTDELEMSKTQLRQQDERLQRSENELQQRVSRLSTCRIYNKSHETVAACS